MDQREFKDKVIPLGPGMLRLATRILKDRSDAADCLQDAFLKLWNMREQLQQYQSLEALSYTMVKNIAIDRIRRKRSLPLSETQFRIPEAESSAAYNELERKDRIGLVQAAMNSLPEQQRMAVHLRDVEGLETEEILAIMGMNENTFRVTLSRARKSIREKINKMDYGNKTNQAFAGKVF